MTFARAASAMAGAFVVAAMLGACALVGRAGSEPVPAEAAAARDWPAARRVGLNAALVRDFSRADSLFRAFAARYPGTPQAAETVFYRALIRLDPATETTASPVPRIRDARLGLDAYVAGGPTLPRYVDAVLLRRLAGHLDSLHTTFEIVSRTVTAAPPGASATPVAIAQALRDSVRARDEEIVRLRTDLEQTKAELERIRRRLAPPRP